jgi:hypothetical protein
MGRDRGASTKEGEEDIIYRESEVDEHEIRGKECPCTEFWLGLTRSPLSHTHSNHNPAPIPLTVATISCLAPQLVDSMVRIGPGSFAIDPQLTMGVFIYVHPWS